MNKKILSIIVVSQFFCTSLWFAGNAVLSELIQAFGLSDSIISWLTSSVQFGFITGTLIFALFSFSDKYSPSKVFFVSALLASFSNVISCLPANNLYTLLIERFLTGFFLAGIYPVGMKIAADYFDKGLGKSLGFLVGALVLGTSFPHLLKSFESNKLPWQGVIIGTSVLALLGGISMLVFVPDGPYRSKGQKFNFSVIKKMFAESIFRKASLGYFGHMWELYAFWAFVPIMISMFLNRNLISIDLNLPLWSFFIIAVGSISCVLAGFLSQRFGIKKVAKNILLLSGMFSLFAPVIFYLGNLILFIIYMFVWGMLVIADSPLFSTMVAKSAPSEIKGSALTLVNCIGFAITILSIQTLGYLNNIFNAPFIISILAVGPIVGVLQLIKNGQTKKR